MRQQAIHFIKAIQGETTCLCGPEDALADLQIAHDYILYYKEPNRAITLTNA